MPLAASLAALIFIRQLGAGARAEQLYVTAGSDEFFIGAESVGSEVRYRGMQVLRITRHGKLVRYSASVTYTRTEQGIDARTKATYVADVFPTGELASSADHDPDYLAVLNQPFAAQLDARTLADLRRLRKPLPFDFPSPFTGASLHGHLQHEPEVVLGKHRGVAVRFEATGEMVGPIPDRAELKLAGAIEMRGTAYYDTRSALLLALNTTVTISGTVSNRAGNDPVRIVYERRIHLAP